MKVPWRRYGVVAQKRRLQAAMAPWFSRYGLRRGCKKTSRKPPALFYPSKTANDRLNITKLIAFYVTVVCWFVIQQQISRLVEETR
jgi:hypothetical protein